MRMFLLAGAASRPADDHSSDARRRSVKQKGRTTAGVAVDLGQHLGHLVEQRGLNADGEPSARNRSLSIHAPRSSSSWRSSSSASDGRSSRHATVSAAGLVLDMDTAALGA